MTMRNADFLNYKKSILASKRSFKRDKYLYVIGGDDDGKIKVGITNSFISRVKQIQTYSPNSLSLLLFWLPFEASKTEKAIHTFFIEDQLQGEWFNLGNIEYSCWKYMLLVEFAIKTSVSVPIPISRDILFWIQYGDNHDKKQFYPDDLFAEFQYNSEEENFAFYNIDTKKSKILERDYNLYVC